MLRITQEILLDGQWNSFANLYVINCNKFSFIEIPRHIKIHMYSFLYEYSFLFIFMWEVKTATIKGRRKSKNLEGVSEN